LALKSAADLFDLGNVLAERGETEAAIAAFRDSLQVAPDHAPTWFNLANALLAAARPVEAVEAFVGCLRVDPELGAAYLNLATTLRGLVMLDQAKTMAEHAVRCMPDGGEAKLCLAAVLHDRAEYAAAVRLYRQVLAREPCHGGALSSLGNSLRALGHVAESLAAHDRAIAAAPEEPEFRFNRATALLAAGDFARGWDEYEWRWRYPAGRDRRLGPAWQGEAIVGRSILLHAEQGLGDTLQFVRYVPMVVARGARVILEVQPSLVRLLQSLPGVEHVIARGDALPAYDTHCPLLSLPRVFSTRLETIPAAHPYLSADPGAVAAWDARLPVGGGLRVGLVWAGSPHRDNALSHLVDLRRSISLAELSPLGGNADVHLISLQKDRADEPSSPSVASLIDLMPEIEDFADTAALVANLDLVIAVDTSVAHLAGGLGRPVWLLARYNGCWRWMHNRADSAWYPGMKIYRQQRPLDWSGVIRDVRADLVAFAQAAATARLPGHFPISI
jgi:tetratricopeptide (TPR) repeat protein